MEKMEADVDLCEVLRCCLGRRMHVVAIKALLREPGVLGSSKLVRVKCDAATFAARIVGDIQGHHIADIPTAVTDVACVDIV